jgi:hypothetical protein
MPTLPEHFNVKTPTIVAIIKHVDIEYDLISQTTKKAMIYLRSDGVVMWKYIDPQETEKEE